MKRKSCGQGKSHVVFRNETKLVLVEKKTKERYNTECVGMFPDRPSRSGISVIFCITYDGAEMGQLIIQNN